MRSKVFKVVVLLLLCGIGVIAWWALHSEEEDGPIVVRFAGTTNFNDRTFVFFAITNQQDIVVRGYSYPIMLSEEGWIETRAHASNMSKKNQRDIWLAPAQDATNRGMVMGVALPTTNVWRLAFSGSAFGPRKLSARQRAVSYLVRNRHFRLARWLMPPPPKPGIINFEEPFSPRLFGPEMRGVKPR